MWSGQGEVGVLYPQEVEYDESGLISLASLSKKERKFRTEFENRFIQDTCLFTNQPRPPTSRNLAAKQLQLECDSLVPSGWIYPQKAGLDWRNEIIPHLMQVVDVALKNLP